MATGAVRLVTVMSVDPDGCPHLLVYAAEGAPNAQMIHFPRYWLDRIT